MAKKTPQINAASMADIAFIILCFFLMVTTMGSEYGMIRMLPPWTDDASDSDQINERNVFQVNVSSRNDLQVRGQITDISSLREMTKDFFDLRNTGENDPEKEQVELPLLGLTTVNRVAVVSLLNDRGTSYRVYMQVQNELTAAIRELRDEFCMQRFGTTFDNSTQEQRDVVSGIFPVAISEAEPREGRR